MQFSYYANFKFFNQGKIGKNPSRKFDSRSESWDMTKKIFIIIDDNKYIRESVRNILERILKEKNYLHLVEILEGSDGVDLLKFSIDYFYTQRIQLVITDENMEFMQGSAAIKILREFEMQNKIPHYCIFSSTSFEDKISQDYIKDAGADFILNKPLNKEKLLQELINFEVFKDL